MKPTVESKASYLAFVAEWKTAYKTLTKYIRGWRNKNAEPVPTAVFTKLCETLMETAAYLKATGEKDTFIFPGKVAEDGTRLRYDAVDSIRKYTTDKEMARWLLALRKEWKVKAGEAMQREHAALQVAA